MKKFILVLLMLACTEAMTSQSTLTKVEFEKNLSSWNGSLPDLVELIKENMHDPKSFKHVETGYKIVGNRAKVRMIYQGKNAFNAVVKGTVIVYADRKGKVVEVISSQ